MTNVLHKQFIFHTFVNVILYNYVQMKFELWFLFCFFLWINSNADVTRTHFTQILCILVETKMHTNWMHIWCGVFFFNLFSLVKRMTNIWWSWKRKNNWSEFSLPWALLRKTKLIWSTWTSAGCFYWLWTTMMWWTVSA